MSKVEIDALIMQLELASNDLAAKEAREKNEARELLGKKYGELYNFLFELMNRLSKLKEPLELLKWATNTLTVSSSGQVLLNKERYLWTSVSSGSSLKSGIPESLIIEGATLGLHNPGGSLRDSEDGSLAHALSKLDCPKISEEELIEALRDVVLNLQRKLTE